MCDLGFPLQNYREEIEQLFPVIKEALKTEFEDEVPHLPPHLKVKYEYYLSRILASTFIFCLKLNPFLTSFPFMDKPGCWFLLAKCLKNTCGRVTF